MSAIAEMGIEGLHPAAQVAVILATGAVAITWLICIFR